MTPRERLLIALDGGKPDRLPATIHGWMDYWRNKYMNGADQFEIYRHFGMDAQIFYFAWLDEPVVAAMYFTGDLVPGPDWRVACQVLKAGRRSRPFTSSPSRRPRAPSPRPWRRPTKWPG